MLRTVSLLASATETVHALGREDWLVGRSHECDHPPSVLALPRVSEPRFDVRLPSREIDRSVRDLVRESLGVYRVDVEALKGLAPEVILTQTQCEVCAVTPRDLGRALCEWMPDPPPTVVHLEPNTLEDIFHDMTAVARALRAEAAGERLVADLRSRMEGLQDRAETAGERPRVAYVEWVDPLMAGGNWMPELVARAGGEALFVGPGEHSPTLEWSRIVEADPDVIFVSPCGYDLERTRQEIPILERVPEWEGLRAVREGRAYVADANAFLTRPGPRVVESQRILCEVLHPEIFSPSLRGTAWDRV